MLQKAILISLASLNPTPVAGQTVATPPSTATTAPSTDLEAEPVSIQPRFVVGDELRYDVGKTRERIENGRRVGPAVTISWEGTARVLEVSEEKVIVSWTMGAPRLDPPVPMPPDAQALMNMMVDVQLRLVLSPDGRYERLDNFEEVRVLSDRAVEQSLEFVRKKGGERAVAAAKAAWETISSNPDAHRSLFVRDVAPMFDGFGWQLQLGKPVELQIELPNPFGGEPLAGWQSVALINGPDESGIVRFKSSGGIHPEALQDAIRQMATAIDVDPPATLPPAERLEEREFEFDVNLGWFRKARSQSIVRSGESQQTDTITWSLRSIEHNPLPAASLPD